MKIVIVGDTHGRDIMHDIMWWESDADLFLHTGDLEEDPGLYPLWVMVRGNCDFFQDQIMEDEVVVEAAGHRLYMTHGDKLPSFERERFLKMRAQEHKCDIAVYGHTHVARNVSRGSVRILNPGSAWRSGDDRPPGYCVLHVSRERVWAQFKYEPDWPGMQEES